MEFHAVTPFICDNFIVFAFYPSKRHPRCHYSVHQEFQYVEANIKECRKCLRQSILHQLCTKKEIKEIRQKGWYASLEEM